MNFTPKSLLGAIAAVSIGATTLLGMGAGPAAANGRVHCDRAERPVWSGDPSRNMTAHGCTLPSTERRWYRVEVENLTEPHHNTEYLNGPVDHTGKLHDRTIKCMGYTTDAHTVNWFGCVPH
ncbi:hypothetical protein [Streptomyces fuscichromogenes]|uniref:Uncharacterized protein n=1 Tax=Streptomyces fuscichromogenes TaxID=1324013 RepID=A0A917XKD8_9ACTN|nr:hypothetical protein [Streptomyces fuscichromogenes]GGN33448.1 hypothetical protein GCM10011578_073280 [Streptomyces fuscichromogenes]